MNKAEKTIREVVSSIKDLEETIKQDTEFKYECIEKNERQLIFLEKTRKKLEKGRKTDDK